MTRNRIALTLLTLGTAGLLTVTGCGAPAPVALDLAAESSALTAVNLEADPTPAAPQGRRRPYLRKNTLHGEVTVQGKDGVKTVVVQRGTVTAADAATIGVKSADGFAQTWTLGEAAKVRGTLKTGAEVGVAGRKDGDATVARLIVVR